MIDTHAHLSKRFCPAVAGFANLDGVILAASNTEESKENIELAKENEGKLWAAVGIHPQQTDPNNKLSIDEQLNLLDDLVENNKKWVKAIGECGLDYSPVLDDERERSKKEQEILFRGQIALSIKHKLPIIVHSRKTLEEIVEIIKSYEEETKGVVHCYTGGKKRIKNVLEMGENWYFGIDGNLTYEDGLAEVVKLIPKDRLILETDSPFLAPIPHRGETNKPEYVKYVYLKLAEIWEMSFEETEKIIDQNARNLFAI
jgi:TatD DNase family protein